MYEIIKAEGVEAAIEWFKTKGKKAAWGGTHQVLAKQLIEDGRVDDGLRLMESDVEATPGKFWLLRKISQACLDNGRPEKALIFLDKGLKIRPQDEEFIRLKAEASDQQN